MGDWHFLEAGMVVSWRMIFGELPHLLTTCDGFIMVHHTQANSTLLQGIVCTYQQ